MLKNSNTPSWVFLIDFISKYLYCIKNLKDENFKYLYLDYYKGPSSKWCHAELTNIEWKYSRARLIDTYSLGMLVPCILCKLAKKHGKMKHVLI